VPKSSWHFTRLLGASVLLAQVAVRGQPATADPAVHDLIEQNHQLQQRVESQQHQIDELRDRLDRLQKEPVTPAPAPLAEPEPTARQLPSMEEAGRQVRISGETGLAFFSGGSDSAYPNSDFRIDESRLFVEAPVWHNTYFFGEIDLMTRENPDDYFHVGELYVDVEDVFSSARDRRLNLRLGRFNIPFGEEYQYRGVMENPLITHSVADLWGFDSGVEVYGSLGPFEYILAVQNGGIDKNKALTARVSIEPVKSLHLSASAHNTGKLDVLNDYTSQIWFGNTFFRGLAPAADAHYFQASVFEVDAAWHWKQGHVSAAGGLVQYDDDSPTVDNSRRLSYYSFEAVHVITGNLSGAARYSEVRAPNGYPLAGEGNSGKYFYNPFAPLTTDLQRLSLGLSYQFGPPFIWKVEYSWERGHLVDGFTRNGEDLLSTEVGIRF
jgi:hypothetical protein